MYIVTAADKGGNQNKVEQSLCSLEQKSKSALKQKPKSSLEQRPKSLLDQSLKVC
jgi:hypothetical protein